MYKLLLALGIIDLTFQFPHLTALTLVGVFLYDKLTDKDKQEIMTIYSNGKEFCKYLTVKAKELGLSIQELRKQVVTDLEIPEAAPDYTEVFNEAEPKVDCIKESLSDLMTEEELKLYEESPALREKLYRTVKEAVSVPNTVWVEAPLSAVYPDTIYENESYKDTYKRWGIHVDWDKNFTEKDFRKLKAKLKALGRNQQGEIIDPSLNDLGLLELNSVYAFFTKQEFNGINYIIK